MQRIAGYMCYAIAVVIAGCSSVHEATSPASGAAHAATDITVQQAALIQAVEEADVVARAEIRVASEPISVDLVSQKYRLVRFVVNKPYRLPVVVEGHTPNGDGGAAARAFVDLVVLDNPKNDLAPGTRYVLVASRAAGPLFSVHRLLAAEPLQKEDAQSVAALEQAWRIAAWLEKPNRGE